MPIVSAPAQPVQTRPVHTERVGFGMAQSFPQAMALPVADTFTPNPLRFAGRREEQRQLLARVLKDEAAHIHDYGERYKQFLGQAVCSPLTAKSIIDEAQKRGFKPWPQSGTVTAQPGDKFYVNNDYESVALLVIGQNNPQDLGFNIVAAHMDSPQLELKQPEAVREGGGIARLTTKTRGGGIWMHWFNRALGLAGYVAEPVLDEQGQPMLDPQSRRPMQKLRFVKLDKPSIAVASEPIHFNRDLNNGRKIQPEEDMTPIAAIDNLADGIGAGEHARAALAKNGIDLDHAHRAELYLYPTAQPQDNGVDGSLVIGAGQDDRAMCFAAMDAIFEAAEGDAPPLRTGMALFFDNEETGSYGQGGARSNWLQMMADDILQAVSPSPPPAGTSAKALSKSVILSADVAHGYLPHQAKYHEKQNHAKIGYGPVIKTDSDGHYATTAQGSALMNDIAARAGVPLQYTSTNQDVRCGTTIGPMIGANTNALTIDMGAPILSMHSPGEIMAKSDGYLTQKLFKAFYQG